MNRSRKSFAKWNMFFHFASMAIGSATALFTLPINLSHIPVALYGAWLATGNIIAWATMIDPGLSAVTQQQTGAAYGKGDRLLTGQVIAAGMVLNLIIAALLAGIATALAFNIPHLIGSSALAELSGEQVEQLKHAALLAAGGLFLNVSGFAVTSSCLGLLGCRFIGLNYLFSLVFAVALQIYLVINGWGIIGIAIATLVRGGIIFSGSLAYLLYRMVLEKILPLLHLETIRQIIGLTSFTFMSRAVDTIAQNIDSFLVVRLITPDAAAILRATKAPVGICVNLVNRPSAAVAPVLSNLSGSGELEQKQDQILRLALFSLWVTALGFVGLVTLNESFIRLWVGGEFFAGATTNLILCLGLVALSGSAFVCNMAFAIGQIKKTALITAGRAIISVLAMGVLGYFFGLPGIAAGAGTGALYSLIFAAILLMKTNALTNETITLLKGETLRIILIVALLSNLNSLLNPVDGWMFFTAQVGAVISLFSLSLFVVSTNMRREIRLAINKSITIIRKR